ncbi:MAG: hypothetical protein HY063_06435 [Bacteroidetes bacterium]|nr:hypothetical protein [Bacteroidota bacterium]
MLLLANFLTAFGQQSDTLKPIKQIQYGFMLCANQTTDKAGQLGFSLGALADAHVAEKLFLQGQFLMSFISFSSTTNNTTKRIETTLLSFPMHILYKPFKLKTNPTVSFGCSPTFDLSSNANKLYFPPRPLFFPLDIGLGLDRQLKYFTITPEIRYSYHQTASFLFLILNFKG